MNLSFGQIRTSQNPRGNTDRCGGYTLSDLIGSVIEPGTPHTDRDVLNPYDVFMFCVSAFCRLLGRKKSPELKSSSMVKI